MQAKIMYKLSSAGQRVDILAGGSGKQMQEILVSREATEFIGVVQEGTVQTDGSVVLDETNSWANSYDAPQTAASILEARAARKATQERESQKLAEKIRIETLAVISEKKVRKEKKHCRVEENGISGYAEYVMIEPAFLSYCEDAEVRKTEAALAFVAECDAANVAAKADAEIAARADLAERIVKAEAERLEKEARDKKHDDWLAANCLDSGDLRLKIEDGAIATVPNGCWESHSRGKNWLAVISVSPSSPGGLARDFAEKAKGEFYYMLPTFATGDAIEFGADYYSGSGRKNAKRWYGFVVALVPASGDEPTWLVVRECNTGKAACKAGEKWAKEHGPLTVADAVDAGISQINGEGAIVPNPSAN